MRGGYGKQSSKFCFLNGNFHPFSSVSPGNLMWKRERTNHLSHCQGYLSLFLCYERDLPRRFSSVKAVAWTKVWNQTKPRNGSCIQHGSHTNFPVTHSTNSLISGRMLFLFWFYCKHKHCYVWFIALFLAKLSTVCHHLNDLKWSFWKAL